jgi:hypothetical protein
MKQQLVLDPLPPAPVLRALSPNGRAHWTERKRAQDTMRLCVVVDAVHSGLRSMPPPVRLQAIWTFPQARRRDQDNLIAVAKCIVDTLVRHRYLQDDRHEMLTVLPPSIRVERGVRKLVLVLESAE